MSVLSILYVEDNEHLRETIGMLMEGDGRDVVLCPSGEDAIKACEQRRFDLVVTDVSLPGLSGTDLARRLLRSDPDRWIVLCSGYDFVDSVGQFGPQVRALRKPFELEDLDALIAEVTASKSVAAPR